MALLLGRAVERLRADFVELQRRLDGAVDDRLADLVVLIGEYLGGAHRQVLDDGSFFSGLFQDLDDPFGLHDIAIAHDFEGLGHENRNAGCLLDHRNLNRRVDGELLNGHVGHLAELLHLLCHVLRPAKQRDIDHDLEHHRERDVTSADERDVQTGVRADLRAKLRGLGPSHEQPGLESPDAVLQVLDEIGTLTALFAGVVVGRGRVAWSVLACDFDDVLQHGDLVDHLVELDVVLAVQLGVVADDLFGADECVRNYLLR